MVELSKVLSERIETLGWFPTPPEFVLRLIEPSKDPDTEVDACVMLIESDASLSSKLPGVINSSWVSPSERVRTIKHIVCRLGTSNVRALAMVHSLAGLYSHWGLDKQDARAYCGASLCKAVAAQILVRAEAPERADEVFAISLFQDIGLGLLAATAGTEFAELLRDPLFTIRAQLRYEFAHFDLDHVTVGWLLGQKLGLPRIYLNATRFHHDEQKLASAVNDSHTARALHVASFVPHDIRSWNPEDILYLSCALNALFPSRWPSSSVASAFIHVVDAEFSPLANMLSQGSATPTSLVELMNKAYDDSVRFAVPLPPQV